MRIFVWPYCTHHDNTIGPLNRKANGHHPYPQFVWAGGNSHLRMARKDQKNKACACVRFHYNMPRSIEPVRESAQGASPDRMQEIANESWRYARGRESS